MAVNFKESKTKENLMRAFAGESQARNRYTIGAEKARQMKMYSIADIFVYTADQERAHAERYYELLKSLSGDTIFIDGGYPVDQQESLAQLIRAAEHNEKEEAENVYQEFSRIAKEEGFLEAASAFSLIAEVERTHQLRFAEVAEMLEKSEYFACATADIFSKESRPPHPVRPAIMSRGISCLMSLRLIREIISIFPRGLPLFMVTVHTVSCTCCTAP